MALFEFVQKSAQFASRTATAVAGSPQSTDITLANLPALPTGLGSYVAATLASAKGRLIRYCTRIDSKPFGYDGTAFARLVDNLANIDSMLPCSRCPHRSISRDQRGNCQITATIAMYRSGTHLEPRGFRVSNRALCSR
jgi:hypothetical protein